MINIYLFRSLQLARPAHSLQPFLHLFLHAATSSPTLQNLQPLWSKVKLISYRQQKYSYLRSGGALRTFFTTITFWVNFTIITFFTDIVQKFIHSVFLSLCGDCGDGHQEQYWHTQAQRLHCILFSYWEIQAVIN